MSLKIGVIGTGYVGIVSGTCLADVGNEVLCVDLDAVKIEKLRRAEVSIYEPGLDKLLERNVREGRLKFTTQLRDAVSTCEVLMFCLPTPPGENGQADLRAVLSAANDVALLMNELDITEPLLVVNKSTVPVGTAHRVEEVFKTVAPDRTVHVVSNPEFLAEGFAVDDFMKPNRIIVGTDSAYAERILREMYEPFVQNGNPIYVFDVKSAEITKYAANAFLATKISFMNELSAYCELVGADIDKIRFGIGSDDRIGKRFLYAGIGYGGSCFPKDVQAIMYAARQSGTPLTMVEATHAINQTQISRFTKKVTDYYNGDMTNVTVAVWGLAFKPNTDDVREAPAIHAIRTLLEKGATIRVFDPEAIHTARIELTDTVTYCESAIEAATSADALFICTEWNEFKNPNFEKLKAALNQPLVFDGRNMFDVEEMEGLGFEYHSIGRRPANSR